MPLDRKVKLRGRRSIESKLTRLANELNDDANRIERDHPGQHDGLIYDLIKASRELGMIAADIRNGA